VQIAIDDATRLVYVEILTDEKAVTAAGFLRRAVAFFRGFGIRIERVMTDNRSACASTVRALACKALKIRHLRTQPYRPRTNGKAERFIRTLLVDWAYGAIYRGSDERRRALAGWLDYNSRRRPTEASTAKARSSAYTRSSGTMFSGPTPSEAPTSVMCTMALSARIRRRSTQHAGGNDSAEVYDYRSCSERVSRSTCGCCARSPSSRRADTVGPLRPHDLTVGAKPAPSPQ